MKKRHGWKWGRLTDELRNAYGQVLSKGEIVQYKRRMTLDEKNCYTGRYEYHYSDTEGKKWIRDPQLLAVPLTNNEIKLLIQT